MRKSEPDSEKNSAPQSARGALSRSLKRELVETRVRRSLEGKESDYSEETIASIEGSLREFQSSCDSGLPFDDLMALMNREIGSLDSLYHEDDIFQGKKIDAQALWTLYGAMLHIGEEPEDAARNAYIYYYHSCEQDEERRRFTIEGEGYRLNQLKDAIEIFDKGDWNRWFNRKHPDGDDNEYGNIVYDTVQALVYIACTNFDPEYILHEQFQLDYDPTSEHILNLANGEFDEYTRKSISFHKIGGVSNSTPYGDSAQSRYVPIRAIVKIAMEVDEQSGGNGRSEDTYKNAIRRLRKKGGLKWAQIKEGVDYRIYPTTVEDPPEAELIKVGDEEYTPEPEEESEPELMTDGGQPISEESRESTERESEQAQSDSGEQAIESSSEGQNQPRANSESNEGDGDDSVGKPPLMTPHM